jgi:hypothetical protein
VVREAWDGTHYRNSSAKRKLDLQAKNAHHELPGE